MPSFRTRRTALLGFAVFVLIGAVALADTAPQRATLARFTPRLQRALDHAAAEATLGAWVYFIDKGEHESAKARVPLDVVSRRSLARRLKVRAADRVVDATDLPVSSRYVETLSAHVARVRQRSKWLNAASIEATPAQLAQVAALPFVRRVDLLARFRRAGVEPLQPARDPDVAPGQRAHGKSNLAPRDTPAAFNYGNSFTQLDQIGVIALHNQGLNGNGVWIGHFDNGHRLLGHQSLAGLNIAATWDFVDHDPDPAPNPLDPPNFGAHGISTLSVLGGFQEGELIGPAFGATYVLARTENDASETPVEEDNWVAAIEWADSIGVDIASTSLGYLDYQAPFPSWTPNDLDGNTTVITRAADMAVARGIVVVNSAGNAGFGVPNTLIAPADGDSVLAVGSVTSIGARSNFSSVGPTADGRTKPDIMAMGSSVRVASTAGIDQYAFSSGTSFSCPLVAGVAALLLEASPAATPLQIRDALRETASQAASPDNLMGWGIVDAVAAQQFLATSDASETPPPATFRLARAFPNPFNPGTTIRFEVPSPAQVNLTIFDVRGRRVRELVTGVRPAAVHEVTWDGRDASGRPLSSGTYFVHVEARELTGAAIHRATEKLSLVR